MGIGTSMGAYYDDEFHQSAAQWDNKYDDNVITPNQADTNKQLGQVEETELGGTPVGLVTDDASSGAPNTDALLRNIKGRRDEKVDELNKGLNDWDNKSKQFREELYDKGLMTPELEEIYNKRFGPRVKPEPKDGTPMSNAGGLPIQQVDFKPITTKTGVTITQEDIDKGINVAMSAGPGTIAGWTSKTADAATRMKAAVMEGKGVPAEEIRQATGWFKGKSDGRWRNEISDDAMKLTDRDWKFGETGKLSDFVEHPELFKAYPELKDIKFKVADKSDKFLGSFNKETNTLTVNPSKIRAGDEGILDVISHELQHAVQSKEGFNLGSNPQEALKDALTATIGIKDKKEQLSLIKDIVSKAQRFGEYMYQRTPGEVEANNVMARRKLTPEQRKSFSPQDTIDLLEGSHNSLSGGTYMKEFNYPK